MRKGAKSSDEATDKLITETGIKVYAKNVMILNEISDTICKSFVAYFFFVV